jgi:hypothetical protein
VPAAVNPECFCIMSLQAVGSVRVMVGEKAQRFPCLRIGMSPKTCHNQV